MIFFCSVFTCNNLSCLTKVPYLFDSKMRIPPHLTWRGNHLSWRGWDRQLLWLLFQVQPLLGVGIIATAAACLFPSPPLHCVCTPLSPLCCLFPSSFPSCSLCFCACSSPSLCYFCSKHAVPWGTERSPGHLLPHSPHPPPLLQQ